MIYLGHQFSSLPLYTSLCASVTVMQFPSRPLDHLYGCSQFSSLVEACSEFLKHYEAFLSPFYSEIRPLNKMAMIIGQLRKYMLTPVTHLPTCVQYNMVQTCQHNLKQSKCLLGSEPNKNEFCNG